MIDRLLPYAEEAHAFARRLSEEVLPLDVYEDLCGACAIASAYLHKRLRAAGIKSRVVVGDGHCFVRAGEWYVDVTAEQFGYAPVYIGVEPPNDNPTYFETYASENLTELLDYLETHGWPWDAQKTRELVLEAA